MSRLRARLALSSVFIATLSFAGCGDDRDGGAAPSGSFLALTYNVAGLPEGLSSSRPSIYTPLISPRLNTYDLVLVQESWLEPDPYPTELFGLHLYHQILAADADHPFKSEPLPIPLNANPERPTAIVSDGLNRFSRFPFDPVIRQRWLECDNSAADCLSLKGFSAARTELAPGVTIDLYNLHMEAGGTANDDRLRRDGVLALAAFIADYSTDRAVIVGGDFNLHADRDPDRGILELLYAEANLTDACVALGCPQPERIDKFLFRSSAQVVVDAVSWSNEDAAFRSDDGEPLSDHDPVAVGFAWATR